MPRVRSRFGSLIQRKHADVALYSSYTTVSLHILEQALAVPVCSSCQVKPRAQSPAFLLSFSLPLSLSVLAGSNVIPQA
ncbi:hypothetical protein SRHO_G00163300 [Serrasalmus rhombeus]